MAPPKKKKQKRQYEAPVYNDICYVSDPGSPPDRCNNDRLHFYIQAWLGYNDYAEEYYKYVYAKTKKVITSVGSVDSFEDLLRKINAALSQDKNKGKKIGDLIILTHGIESHDQSTGKTITVKIKLPLISMNDPDNSARSLPIWWKDVSDLVDSQEINKLQVPNSDYYNYVDGKDKKDGLISVVVNSINNYLDDSSRIWFVGCNLGLNPDLLKAMRKLFSNKPSIYAFNKRHIIAYYWDGDVSNCTRCWEEVRKRGATTGPRLWTEEGMKAIVHEP
jgi:hypothetical protein